MSMLGALSKVFATSGVVVPKTQWGWTQAAKPPPTKTTRTDFDQQAYRLELSGQPSRAQTLPAEGSKGDNSNPSFDASQEPSETPSPANQAQQPDENAPAKASGSSYSNPYQSSAVRTGQSLDVFA
jgi:hypothetical protein